MIAKNMREFHRIVCKDGYCKVCLRKLPENELCGHHVKTKGAHPELKLETDNGICVCAGCHNLIHLGHIKHWKEMQAGHYFHNRLDFDERNVHPQCPQCNYFMSGSGAVYGVELAKELGVEGLERLHIDSNVKGNKFSNSDLLELEQKIKDKIKILESNANIC